jgi:predicted GNAT family acetyltransferase
MEPGVQRNDERSRYEAVVDGALAGFASTRDIDGATAITHTVVEDAYEGQGIGGRLVRAALDDLRERGARVIPLCSFAAAWIERHEDYADLVDHDALARLRG